MNNNETYCNATKITNEKIISELTKLVREKILEHLPEETPSREVFRKLFENKVAKGLEFWCVSDEAASYLRSQEQTIIFFGGFSIWVKDYTSDRKLLGDDFDEIEKSRIILFFSAFFFSSKFFLNKPFPKNWNTLNEEKILDYVKNNLNENYQDLPPEQALKSVHDLTELLIEFGVSILTSSEIKKDAFIRAKEFMKNNSQDKE